MKFALHAYNVQNSYLHQPLEWKKRYLPCVSIPCVKQPTNDSVIVIVVDPYKSKVSMHKVGTCRYLLGGKVDLFTAAAAVAVSSWLPRSEDLSHHKTPPSGVSCDGHAAMPPSMGGERGRRGEGPRTRRRTQLSLASVTWIDLGGSVCVIESRRCWPLF